MADVCEARVRILHRFIIQVGKWMEEKSVDNYWK